MSGKPWSASVRVVWLAVVLWLGLGLVSTRTALAQAGYVVQDLGTLPGDTSSVAWAINERGDVVGWSAGPNGRRAFVYTDANGMVALPGLPGRPFALARDINESGVIVGTADAGGVDLGHAVVWIGSSVQDLGTLGTGSYSEAWGVNNLGQVVGSSYTNGGSLGTHAFLYTPGTDLVDLTPNSDTGFASDINDSGQVTGYMTAFQGYHAFRWQAGTFLDLGVLPDFADSFGWAINASGQVAGSSGTASGNSERFIRFTDGRGLQNLGGVGEHNVALGINASGDVVGHRGQSASRAVRYTDAAGLQDLDTLIDPSLGWVILAAMDINDNQQVAGYAFNNFTGQTHAMRLQPTAAPPPECTFHCLRSTSIELSSKGPRSLLRRSVNGSVTVNDENGAAIANALIAATWTQPSGGTSYEYAWTSSRGIAAFATPASSTGTYTLTVVNIVLSLYTFDPGHSLLGKSITVTK
jgi:probable HAF family extracellular repeat protein